MRVNRRRLGGQLRGVRVARRPRSPGSARGRRRRSSRSAPRRRDSWRRGRTRRSATTRRPPGPSESSHRPSAMTWSPVCSSTQVVERPPRRSSISLHRAVTHDPGALGVEARRSWSSVRLARTSWMMPIAELATMTRPNRPFCQRPVARMTTNRVSSRPLKNVKMLVRRISLTERLVFDWTALVRPSRTRSATSGCVSPDDGVRMVGRSSPITSARDTAEAMLAP